ncbi:unnamed protein product [Adineta ricciae]|uniref:Uncharacterized protein n=1 Tax=Adineta ricciae TaxID=249248 RepID=A0A815L5K7_ADIRI|nr:unnamed protein product [Adineta ricciae]CAF1404863.1 unnamed protein product [Adineta ricciae]
MDSLAFSDVPVPGESSNHNQLIKFQLINAKTTGWAVTGNMNIARFQHTATMLSNGKVSAADGAYASDGWLNNAELYGQILIVNQSHSFSLNQNQN